ncbi:ROK family protein [Marinobacter sp. CHS3-4]|uniref:ROK family protein n=1 Tax=Marinobacter sp. CHS3-4 TaxID=3045174 RepID=UPI0024B51D35|nr:ROK family protein [Marinobacter sp. CHS3-4]MDI9245834.1 ROK family protein [Marinobacter sp. CHS3-4]
MKSNWFIGVDLGGTKIEVILLDRQSTEHFRARRPTPAGDYQATLETIRTLVLQAEAQAGASGVPVGIGIPGSVSGTTGCVKNGNSTWLNGQPMQEHLRALLQRPVTLTNDANCLALSEATDGAGENHMSVFAAVLGTGCGAGVSINGQVIEGPNGVAGEWGHNPLAWTPQAELEQRPCFCGRFGCNETFLSGTGLSLTHHLMTGVNQSAQHVVAQASVGDQDACETMKVYLEHLTRGLASVINVLDPDIIVLGGGMSNARQLYEELPNRLADYVFGGECSTPIRQAVHGDSSGVRGAAWLAGNLLG